MGRRAELTGRRFGMLVATAPAFKDDAKQWHWHVKCDCGNLSVVQAHSLLASASRSCGCTHVTHGATRGGMASPEYHSHKSMIQRCTNPNATGYENYGGRGIRVCPRWFGSFEYFLADMGRRPEGTTLDRIDGAGDYEPGNCRWATKADQNRSKRGLVILTVDGERATVAEWARRSNIDPSTLSVRIQRLGWDHKKAVTTPTGTDRRPRPATVLLTVNGETASIREWGERRGIAFHTLWRRVQKLGWDHARAVNTPVGPNGPKRQTKAAA